MVAVELSISIEVLKLVEADIKSIKQTRILK